MQSRLTALPTDPDVNDHAVFLYAEIESQRREIDQLLTDPALGQPALRPNHLAMYKGWKQRLDLVEARILPVLERFSAEDRRMTRLSRELMLNVAWPSAHTPPIVGALSAEYYGSVPLFRVVYVPAAEGSGLLGIPDICHELAHLLYYAETATLLGTFPNELSAYFVSEKARVAAGQRPPEYGRLYDVAAREWVRHWAVEFVCDMVAVYAVGAPYAWQHLRLCVGGRNAAFTPSLGQRGSHPADAARMHGILAMLRGMGAGADADEVERVWNEYLIVAAEARPTEFDLCYPPTVIESLANQVRTACMSLHMRPFTAAGAPAVDIPGLLMEAWRHFRAYPATYRVWEEGQLAPLWKRLGT